MSLSVLNPASSGNLDTTFLGDYRSVILACVVFRTYGIYFFVFEGEELLKDLKVSYFFCYRGERVL